jgi:hypothetical protein
MADSEVKPTENQVIPNHIGAIGEAIFNATYDPPDPIPEVIRDFARGHAPDWVDIEDLNIQSHLENTVFVIEKETETLQWTSDAKVAAWYRMSLTDDKELYKEVREEYGNTNWEYTFPVEIKTGSSATLEYDNQREVMEELAQKDDVQPIIIIINLSITNLPKSFTVENLTFIH